MNAASCICNICNHSEAIKTLAADAMRRAAPSTATNATHRQGGARRSRRRPPHMAASGTQVVTLLPDEIILLSTQERNEITQPANLVCVKEKIREVAWRPSVLAGSHAFYLPASRPRRRGPAALQHCTTFSCVGKATGEMTCHEILSQLITNELKGSVILTLHLPQEEHLQTP